MGDRVTHLSANTLHQNFVVDSLVRQPRSRLSDRAESAIAQIAKNFVPDPGDIFKKTERLVAQDGATPRSHNGIQYKCHACAKREATRSGDSLG
jgi:hypothetical protein